MRFMSIHASFANYKHLGLCPTRDRDKSTSSTILSMINCQDILYGMISNMSSVISEGKSYAIDAAD